jgi:dihydroxyacetone kinase
MFLSCAIVCNSDSNTDCLHEDQHFINNPIELVNSALKSAAGTNPSLALDAANKIVYCKNASPNEVALISGGGAGHEPAFVG